MDVSHIPELTDIEHTEAGVRFGVSCTLSNMEHELASAVEREPGSLSSKFPMLHTNSGPLSFYHAVFPLRYCINYEQMCDLSKLCLL